MLWCCVAHSSYFFIIMRVDVSNTMVDCIGFHPVQFEQLFERIQHWHPCPWFFGSASSAFLLLVSVIPGTWAAPLQSRSCLITSLRPLTTEVQLRICHRWIAFFAPTPWLLVVLPFIDRWYCSLGHRTRYPTTYSNRLLIYHPQLMFLMWQVLLLASLVADELRRNQRFISVHKFQFCLLTLWIRKRWWKSLQSCPRVIWTSYRL